jgi:nucleoside phosphorylase
MSEIDVLVIAALPEEHEAARDVASTRSADGDGVARWDECGADTATPYLLGKYVVSGGRSMTVALARPTRMGGTPTSEIAATLIERLKPHCLAMCGVCAGNPGDVALGDVIIAEMVYAYDEGKRTESGFQGDHRQSSMLNDWLRAAQDLSPDGLPSFGPASDEESATWVLERLYAADDPMKHPARARYFPDGTWAGRIGALEKDRLVRRVKAKLVLTARGRSVIDRKSVYDLDVPRKLPFRIKVGPIASGNVVVKDGITWDSLKSLGVRSVLGLEMEAATIGSAARRLSVPCSSKRSSTRCASSSARPSPWPVRS